jgi:hypothetical protein
MAPGVPADRLEAVRKAFMKYNQDLLTPRFWQETQTKTCGSAVCPFRGAS